MVPCNETLKDLDYWHKTIDYFQPHKQKFPPDDDSPNKAGLSTKDKSNNSSVISPSIHLKYNSAFGHWHELSTSNPLRIKFAALKRLAAHMALCFVQSQSEGHVCRMRI